ncbi:M1 family aminopeptidase [Gemmatimonadota bacterium]
MKNTASGSIHRLALDWSLNDYQTLEITIQGKPVQIIGAAGIKRLQSPLLFELPEVLPPGKDLEIILSFSMSASLKKVGKARVTGWYPRLWWEFQNHDDYEVKIDIPSGWFIAPSGSLDPETGFYHARDVRTFGFFVGKGYQVMEDQAGETLVRCVYNERSRECAQLLLETAVDVINFYREHFGFYPHNVLTIVPGDERSVGGSPIATNLVEVHSQERMSELPELHWRWITAHEIGHQYWGEYILEKDSPGWLWIGLGIYADREYVQARNLGLEKHQNLMSRYLNGVRRHLDTTVDITPEKLKKTKFDFNNVVIHGKGYSIISALACFLGKETFDRIYKRCLKEYAGRQLGADEFQAVCEEECGKDLDWFFYQWLRTNRHLYYKVSSQECTEQNGRYISKVVVDCPGTLKMPVPVEACFEDGTCQREFTDRFLDVNTLFFESTSPLKEGRVDPDNELAMVLPTPSTEEKLIRKLTQIPWVGGGKKALALFNEAQENKPANADFWGDLGVKLFDGEYYQEALQAFALAELLADHNSLLRFKSLAWEGHILDILGRRQEAIAKYREALNKDTGGYARHDQYGMTIDRKWINKRLKEPFQRK